MSSKQSDDTYYSSEKWKNFKKSSKKPYDKDSFHKSHSKPKDAKTIILTKGGCNWIPFISECSETIRATYGIGEILLTRNLLPEQVSEYAAYKGLWVRFPATTGDNSLVTTPYFEDVDMTPVTDIYSTPIKVSSSPRVGSIRTRTQAGLDDYGFGDASIEAAKRNLEKMQERLTKYQDQRFIFEMNDYLKLSADERIIRSKTMDRAEAQLRDDISAAKEELKEAKTDQEKKVLRAEKEFNAYRLDANKMMGWLLTRCDTILKDELNLNATYNAALNSADFLRAIFVIRSIVCGVEDQFEQVKKNMERLERIRAYTYKEGSDFGAYCNEMMLKIKEYKDMKGEYSETSLIRIIADNAGDFATQVKYQWASRNSYPDTITEAIRDLKLYKSQMPQRANGKKGSSNVDSSDSVLEQLQKTVSTLSAQVNGGRGGRGGRGNDGRGGRTGRGRDNPRGKTNSDNSGDTPASASLCRHFSKYGKCDYPDCKFAHDESMLVCIRMASAGKCPFGENCHKVKYHDKSRTIFNSIFNKKSGNSNNDSIA